MPIQSFTTVASLEVSRHYKKTVLFVYIVIFQSSQQNTSFIEWDFGSFIQMFKTVPGTEQVLHKYVLE